MGIRTGQAFLESLRDGRRFLIDGEPVKDISIEGMKTGSFSQSVGGALTVALPGGSLGGTTIVTKVDTKYAAEQFESFSLTAKNYSATMTD